MLSASRQGEARQGRSGAEAQDTGSAKVVAPKASAEAIRLMKVMESVSSGAKNEEAVAKAKVTEVMEKLGDVEGGEQTRAFSEDEVFLALYDHEFDVDRTLDYLKRHRVVGGSTGSLSGAADKENSDMDEQGEKWTAVEAKKSKPVVDNDDRTQHRMDNGFGSRQDSRQRQQRRAGRAGGNRGRGARRFSGNTVPQPQRWSEDGEMQEPAGETPGLVGEQTSERGAGRGRRRFNNQRRLGEGRGGHRRARATFRNYSGRQESESKAETEAVTENRPLEERHPPSTRRQMGGFSRYRGEQRGPRGGQRFRGGQRRGFNGHEDGAFGSPMMSFDFDDLFTSTGDFVNGQVFTRRVFPSRQDHRAPSEQVPSTLSQHHTAVEEVRPSPAAGLGSWADLARSPRNTTN